jgi:subtilisin family serine protease
MKNKLRLLLAMLLAAVAVPFIIWDGGSAAQGNASPAPSQERAEKFRKSGKPVRDHYIVVLKPETPSEEVEAVANELLAQHGGTTRYIYKTAIKGFSIELPEAAAIALSRNPKVEYVEEDAEAKADTSENTNNWNLDRIDSQFGRNGLYYFPNNETGAGVNAYILDSGLKLSHRQFSNLDGSGNRATLDADMVWWDGQNGNDCTGHGTAVASVLGGRNFGVAKGVRLHGVRIFGCSDLTMTSTIIAGVDWVTQNSVKPAVANLSLDVPGWLNGSALDDAIRTSIFTGVTYVVSAGDENGDVKDVTPARIPEVITVAATDINDVKTATSNFGPGVDVFAPGQNIMVAFFDDSNHNGISDDFAFADGTSFAAPAVAGAVARFLGVFPNASPAAAQGAVVTAATGLAVQNPGAGTTDRLLYADLRHAFLGQQFVPSISEASTGTDTGVDLSQSSRWLAMTGSGSIWSGVLFSNTNGPQGWFAQADGAGFPIQGAAPYSLIGTLGTNNFYIGVSNFISVGTASGRLFLRTNDDHPGDGSGAFSARVESWKALPQARADFVSQQNVPIALLPGQSVTVSITMQNRGPQVWNAWGNFRLASVGNSMTWGPNRAPVLTDTFPGSQFTFTFPITAPAVPGTYNFQWRMLDEGVQTFGDVTPNIPITVVSPSNQAEFVSQNVKSVMTAGEFTTVSITMKNTGNTTWSTGSNFWLGSQNPQDNTTWGFNRVVLPNPVPPGTTVTFTFDVFAPATKGTFNFQWRMVQDGVEWFGPLTPNVAVSVKPPACLRC